MNKVLAFLEQNVQWLVLGLGGLFVIWMAWLYVIKTPISTKIGAVDLGPGDVDKYILDNPVHTLDLKMQDKRVPDIAESTPLDTFKSVVAEADYQPQTLDGFGFYAPFTPTNGFTGSGPGVPGATVIKVAKLPEIPPAVMGEVVEGASNVTAPNAVAAAPAQPPAGAVQPVAAVNGVDKIWATVGFKISTADLAASFKSVMVSQFLSRTAVVDVKLIRQEMLPSGTWGNETTVSKLTISQLRQIPAATASVADFKDYLNWAIPNQPLIMQPPFYTVLQGDAWREPGDANAAAPVVNAAPAEPFDPKKKYTPEELKTLTPEQLREWQIEQQKEREDEAKSKAKPPARPPTGGGGGRGLGGGPGGGVGSGGGGGGRGRGAPNDNGRPPGPPPGINLPPMPGASRAPSIPSPSVGDQRDGGTPTAPPSMAAGAKVSPPPTVEFDPSTTPDLVGWAHDETVEPGHTFRYKIVYQIKNPIFNSPKYAEPPALAATFALSSDPAKTEWTKEVKVPARTSFYIAVNARENSPTVKLEVFAWQGGQKRTKSFEVAPGDIVGAVDNGVDFNTGYTVVDIGRDSRTNSTYVLLSNPDGTLVRRDYLTDQANPDYQSDKKSSTAVASAAGKSPGE